jgi:hypothetical protein
MRTERSYHQNLHAAYLDLIRTTPPHNFTNVNCVRSGGIIFFILEHEQYVIIREKGDT